MSFQGRLCPNEIRIEEGSAYSNDLQPRYEEHRRIDRIDPAKKMVYFSITHGKRTGRKGNCNLDSFWHWARKKVDAASGAG